MVSLLLLTSSFLNFIFYIYAIGFVVALGLEQIVRKGGNERGAPAQGAGVRFLLFLR